MNQIRSRAFLSLIEAAIIVLITAPALAQYQPLVSHVAGNLGGPGMADGQGTAARFTSPWGVWSDGKTLYIADSRNHTIRRMDVATRSVTTIAGTPGVEGDLDGPLNSAQFRYPTMLWGDGRKIYVTTRSSVRVVDLPGGMVTTLPGLQVRQAIGIWGMGEYLYVLEPGYQAFRSPAQRGSIRRVDLRTGVVETLPVVLPTDVLTPFTGPTAIWGDGEHLYVAYNGRGPLVGELDVTSNVLHPILSLDPQADYQYLNGLWGDGQGYLYASDAAQHLVLKINIATGESKIVLGASGPNIFAEGLGTIARLRTPLGGAIVNGALYVADGGSHIIVTAGLETFTMRTAAGLSPANLPGEGPSTSSIQFGRSLWSNGSFVYSVSNSAVQKVSIATGETYEIPLTSGMMPLTLRTPAGVWGSGSNLYVLDASDRSLRRIASTGETTVISTAFNGTSDLWGDDQNLYVGNGNVISKFNLATGTLSTFAGSGAVGGADGIGIGASFRGVRGLWGDGIYLYAVDYPGRTIRRISLASAEVATFAGTDFVEGFEDGIGPAAQFFVPEDVWGDGTYLYVTDYNRIRRVSIATGEVTTIAGRRGSIGQDDGIGTVATFQQNSGTWGSGRRLFISDSGRLRQMDLDTLAVSTLAGRQLPPSDGVGAAARIYGPTGIWGNAENLYITDRYSVRRLNRTTRAVSTIAGFPGEFGSAGGAGLQARFNRPVGIWGDGVALYVADSHSKLIRRITLATGEVTRLAGTADAYPPRDGVGADAIFGWPQGVWGDGTYLYISDTDDQTIRRLTLATNEVVTIAGVSRKLGFQDGPGPQARFHSPTQLSGDGNFLYVTDVFNDAIRRISLSNYEVTTLKIFGPGAGPPGSVEAYLTAFGNSFADGRFLYMTRGNAVLKIDIETGAHEIIAGSTRVVGSEDGPGSLARFQVPVGLWTDKFTMYVADNANDAIRAIDLVPAAQTRTFSVSSHGSISLSSERPPNLTVGYARIQAQRTGNYGLPGGMAIFGYRQNGVLVSEVSVPAAALVSSGRIFAEVAGPVNTGIAIANPNSQPVIIDFYFTDANGNNFGQGSTVIGPNRQIAAFLNETPFNGVGDIHATFTFKSSLLVSAIALRGFTNERSEFLMTSVPVGEVTNSSPGTVTIPHFADGGGWKTSVVVMNPTDGTITGEVRPYSQNGQPLAMTLNGVTSDVFSYSIPPRSFTTFRSGGLQSNIDAGFIAVNSTSTTSRPFVFVMFRYSTNGVTVTESSVAAQSASMVWSMFVESAGNLGASGSIQSGIAIAHNEADGANIHFELFGSDGKFIGGSSNIQIPGRWQTSMFLNQIPGLPPIPSSFRGVLRVWSDRNRFSRPGVSVTGLRGRYNERGEFLFTSTPAIAEVFATTSSELLFPHFAIGGGYETEFVLFSDNGSSGTVYFFDQNGNPLSLGLQ